MAVWQHSRVLTAAQFTGHSLLVQVTTLRRGTSTLLHLRVGPQREDDPDVYEWRHGLNGYPPTPAVWPHQDVDPWQAASYFGPLPSSPNAGSEQSCNSCGARRKENDERCDQCGIPFDDVEGTFAVRVAQLVGDIAAGQPMASTRGVKDLVAAYMEMPAQYEEGRSELLEYIEADFAESKSANFIRGEPSTVTPDLTLASAQDIHEAVAATGRLRTEQIQHAELLLRYAPLHFGYWGPFKALVKAVPVADTPDAYADALARLSGVDWSRPAPTSVRIEDMSFLSGFFDTARRDTLAYLARRARRDLAALAKLSPDVYARVASRMILSWDQNLSRNAYAPAHVMLGGRSPLDAHSHRVVLDPDMSSRRDAHPEIWNERPELVHQVFDNVKNSVEALTWCFQVLESLGHAPAITVEHLKLALLSGYPPLNLAACAELSSRPGLWDSLTVTHWSAVYRGLDDSIVDGIIDGVSVGTPRPAVTEAARDFLISDVPKAPPRLRRIALLFLSATQPIAKQSLVDDANAYVAAVVALIAQSAMEHEKLWSPVVDGLDLEHLERLYQAIADDDRSGPASSAIFDLLLRKRAEHAHPAEAINWIGSTNALEAELGWGLISDVDAVADLLERVPGWIAKRLPDSPTLERVISGLFSRAALSNVPQLGRVVQQALESGVEHANLIALLTNTPLGRAVIWHAMATQHGTELAALVNATPDAIRAAANEIEPGQLVSATGGQLSFVLRYITDNPDRIAGDAMFGAAAAISAEPTLRLKAIGQLHASGQFSRIWFALAESMVRDARAAARDYVASLNDAREFRDAVLTCLDSGVPAVHELGMQLLHERQQLSEDPALWTALAESDDFRIQEVVAAEALVSDQVEERVLPEFDRRVLLAGRRHRRAKESVKTRLDATPADSGLAAQDRITALMYLARGQTVGDREWALGKLTELALSGVAIDGFDVSLVTDGDA